MIIKLFVAGVLLVAVLLTVSSQKKMVSNPGLIVDSTWWNGLSAEWRDILLINQQFSKQGIDLFALQKDYANRLKKAGEPELSAMNTSLHELNDAMHFNIGYKDLYVRAVRKKMLVPNDTIDLESLAMLDVVYMVNGPADLSPLARLPHLKVLIINYCGIQNYAPFRQALNLQPIKSLTSLRVLHCASTGINSLKDIGDLVNLEELDCSNSNVTTLSPLKKMSQLKKLSVGSDVLSAPVISKLENLQELTLKGCKKIPDLGKLKKLKKLLIAESELSIVDGRYRLTDLGFLSGLVQLEHLDLQYTSYKGSLQELDNLPNLKSISLPRVSSNYVADFKRTHENCVILNAYEW